MEPFLGQIGIFGFNYAPRGWAKCDGSVLPIQQYTALYSILGNAFGGDGKTTFALPDLRGRVPVSFSGQYYMGLRSGSEAAALTVSNLPSHTHALHASSQTSSATPGVNTPANSQTVYRDKTTNAAQMNTGSITSAGGSQIHENRQPYLAINFCIAVEGIYPVRN